MPDPALHLSDVEFAYGDRVVLRLPSLRVDSGQSCAVMGPSGCGKTTLLHLIAGLLRPTRGVVRVSGQDLSGIGRSACDRFRGRYMGIVFQRLHLLPALTVLENLALAQRCARVAQDRNRAITLLDQLGVAEVKNAHPSALSLGQAQRVAIARALVHWPALLLADEPSSSLDDANAVRALELLRGQAKACGAALVVVTHDRRIRGQLDTELSLGEFP